MNLSRKEREREFRRNEILSAALDIFAAKGFTHTTLDEVAEASEFGKGTLYNYFQNKEELYTAILETIFESFVENLKEIDARTTDYKTFTREVIHYMLDFCVNNKSGFILLSHKRMSTIYDGPPSANTRITTLIEEAHAIQTEKLEAAIKEGVIREMDPKKLVSLMRGTVFSFAYFHIACTEQNGFDLDAEADYLLSVIFDGIKKN